MKPMRDFFPTSWFWSAASSAYHGQDLFVVLGQPPFGSGDPGGELLVLVMTRRSLTKARTMKTLTSTARES
jgi:hypothetical protein